MSPTWTPFGRRQPALALDDGDLPGLQQSLEALPEAADDLVLVGVDAVHVDAVEACADTDGLALAGGVGDLGRVQQRLRRDAATVQAGAAHPVSFDQHHLHPELGGTQGAGVAPAAGAEDDDVGGLSRHVCSHWWTSGSGCHLSTLAPPHPSGVGRVGFRRRRPVPAVRRTPGAVHGGRRPACAGEGGSVLASVTSAVTVAMTGGAGRGDRAGGGAAGVGAGARAGAGVAGASGLVASSFGSAASVLSSVLSCVPAWLLCVPVVSPVPVAVGSGVCLPQSLCATARTASPWCAAVWSWAAAETLAPWLPSMQVTDAVTVGARGRCWSSGRGCRWGRACRS